jgi:hypothetical protein
MSYPLAKLAHVINWDFLEESFGAVYTHGPDGPLTDTIDGRSVDPEAYTCSLW